MAASVEEKRQLIYAALLRYAPTSVPLRDRIIDQLTIGGMLGSSKEQPFTVGTVMSNIFAGSKKSLRVERIQESLARLGAAGLVERTEFRKKHAYYLLEAGIEKANQVLVSVKDLFDASLQRILSDIEDLCPYEVAAETCRTFLIECFSRFGVQMAKTVTGQLQPGDLFHQADVRAAFEAAVSGKDLSREASESLHSRCMELLQSMHPDDVLLRFLITQGYYFAQLAEYGSAAFNPLIKESYSGSVLLLDTNVLLLSVLDDESQSVFHELLNVAREMGIELKVTAATTNEALGVLSNHKAHVLEILQKAPEELVRRANDEIVDAYFAARNRQSDLTVEEYFDVARDKIADLPAEWNTARISVDEDAMLNGRAFPQAEAIIQEEALRSRGWRKPDATLRHDVAHYAFVLDERQSTRNVWFLTRDRGLPVAAGRLAEGSFPFTFDLVALLETVSPFITSGESARGVADVLAKLVSQNLLPKLPLFNVYELKLLVEMHEDVLSTPSEQLIRAVDYVKHSVLAGRTYNPAQYNEVALGLKSFIASSAADQRVELESQKAHVQAEMERQTRAALEEREIRKERDAVIEQQLGEITDLQETRDRQGKEIEALRIQTQAQSDQIADLKSFQENIRLVFGIARWSAFLVSVIVVVVLASASARIAGYIQWKTHWSGHWNELNFALRLIGAVIAVVGTAILVRRRSDWQLQGRGSVVGLVVIFAMFLFRLVARTTPVYSVAALAVLIGTAAAVVFQRPANRGGAGT